MIIGIDASNIRTGGGKKHLINFINYSLENNSNLKFVLISNYYIIKLFSKNNRVQCHTNLLLNSFNFLSFLSQIIFSSYYLKKNNCEMVFVPGGIFLGNFKPIFSMSQNMLPFEPAQLKDFKFIKKLKFNLMRALQLYTFKKSKGVIFLTDYAKAKINEYIDLKNNSIVIPHGVDKQSINHYNFNKEKFNILYVSDFLPYKHNYNVVKAVSELILEGYSLDLTLIGKKDVYQYGKIYNIINNHSKLKNRINIMGQLDNTVVQSYYKNSSMFLFASTCENLPFILLEAMSFGLPIISSDKRPMRDMLSGKNIFFDSTNIESIKKVIIKNLSEDKCVKMSSFNFKLSNLYLFETNAQDTLNFFKKMTS